jgi:hypothetical protein
VPKNKHTQREDAYSVLDHYSVCSSLVSFLARLKGSVIAMVATGCYQNLLQFENLERESEPISSTRTIMRIMSDE